MKCTTVCPSRGNGSKVKDMKKIYGNSQLLATLAGMRESGRTAHSLIFYGEKGSGRKLMAEYYTSQLLCESPVNGAPCGKCAACRNVSSMAHPDVTYVPTEGKLGGYTANIARAVIRDSVVKPNNHTGRKVYIFRDCNKMSPITQNILLKLIEEPPDHAYFIFTAESKYEFLPTIISRCVCFGVSPCTEAEAEESLLGSGYDSREVSAAVECFHGNIGQCTDYIVDPELRKRVDLTKRLADSIIEKDEYGLNLALFSLGSSRNDIREVLSMTDKLVRDCAVLNRNAGAALIGCYREGARKLSGMVTAYQAVRLHERIEKAWGAMEANVNPPLVLAALSAEMIEIVR